MDLIHGSENWQLQPEDIIVERSFPENLAVSEGAEPNLIVDLEITDQLRREGWARDIVRHIQQTRKDIDLDIQDHILIQWKTDNQEIRRAVMECENYLKRETLCEEITEMEICFEHTKEIEIGGSKLMLLVEKWQR